MRIREFGVGARDDREVEAERRVHGTADHARNLAGGAPAVVEHDVAGDLQRFDLTQTLGCQHLTQRGHLQRRRSADAAKEGDDAGHEATLRRAGAGVEDETAANNTAPSGTT